MIQDIFPKIFSNVYIKKHVDENSLIILFNENKLLLKFDVETKTIRYPSITDVGDKMDYIYLFSIDEENFFLCKTKEVICPKGYDYYDLRYIRKESIIPKHYIFAAYTSFHLNEWYKDNEYCGRCGSINVDSSEERAKVCPACGKIEYPRINPAVIVGVKNGDKLLLTKYRTGYAHNALVAGFTEIGETLEETVEREVMEETGLRVKNIRYYKSQPWGIACDILTGFYCDVDGDDNIKMDEQELKYAQWVERNEIELQPLEYSLTNEMMKMFKENRI